MNLKIKICFSLILFLTFLSGCGSSTPASSTPSAGSCTSTTAPTYSSVSTILANECINCHTGHSHSFTTMSSAISARNSIYSYVSGGSMPPSGSGFTVSTDKDAILQWAACGATN